MRKRNFHTNHLHTFFWFCEWKTSGKTHGKPVGSEKAEKVSKQCANAEKATSQKHSVQIKICILLAGIYLCTFIMTSKQFRNYALATFEIRKVNKSDIRENRWIQTKQRHCRPKEPQSKATCDLYGVSFIAWQAIFISIWIVKELVVWKCSENCN